MSAFNITTFSTRNELYDYSTFQDGRIVAVLGHIVAFDSPTEFWTFDSSSSLASDGINVIKPTDIVGNGRFVLKSYQVQQFGTVHSKTWRGKATVSGSTTTFDISSAGFTEIIDWDTKAYLSSAVSPKIPIAEVTAKSITSVTVGLFRSKTTNTLLISSAEGLEPHAVAGTEVYLTVYGK